MAEGIEHQLRRLGEHLEAEVGAALRSTAPPTLDLRRDPARTEAWKPPEGRRGSLRRWAVVAAAAAVLVVILVSTLRDGTEPNTLITGEPTPGSERVGPPIDAEEAGEGPVATPPAVASRPTAAPATSTATEPARSAVIEPSIAWTDSGRAFDPASMVLVGDGAGFYLISDNGLEHSADGLTWEEVPFAGEPPSPPLFSSPWTDTAAVDGEIVHLSMQPPADRPDDDVVLAQVDWFDAGTGVQRTVVLPFPATRTDDLRGWVAINRRHESLAYVFDASIDGGPGALFRSDDGVDWVGVDAGELPAGALLGLAPLGDGFLAIVEDTPSTGVAFWDSTDGERWAQRAVGRSGPGSTVTWTDDAVIVFHESAFGPQALSANQALVVAESDIRELRVDLEPLEGGGGYGPAVAAGEFGIVALAPVSDANGDDAWYVEFSPDGVAWGRERAPFRAQGLGLAYRPVANQTTVLVPASGSIWVGTVDAGG